MLVIEKLTTVPSASLALILAEAGVPSGKVRSMDDVYQWEQVRSQGLLLDVEHATKGSLQLPGSPIRFDEQPFSGGRSEHDAPPTLGQHNASIREWLDTLEA